MEINSVSFFKSQPCPVPEFPPLVAGWKIKNPQNVGSMMRLVDNVGGTRLVLLDDENSKREREVRKLAGMSYAHIDLQYQDSATFYRSLSGDYKLVAVETADISTNIYRTELPSRVVFLLGGEVHGLSEEWLARCDQVVHIPMSGRCKSMNVSQALAVSLFEWQRQQLFSGKGEL